MGEFGRGEFGAFEFGDGRAEGRLLADANATAALWTSNRVRVRHDSNSTTEAELSDSVATAAGELTVESEAVANTTESGVHATSVLDAVDNTSATMVAHTRSTAVAWASSASRSTGYTSGLVIHVQLDARGSPTAGIFTVPTESFAAQHPELVETITPDRQVTNERERLEGYLKTPFTTPRGRDGEYVDTDFGGLVASFAEFAQGAASIRDRVLEAHYVNYAAASSLDRLGALVFVARRNGETDDHYRPRIKTALQRFLGGATLEQIQNTIATLLVCAPSEINITEPRFEESARIKLNIPDSTLAESTMSIEDLIELAYLFRAGGVEIAIDGRGYFRHRSLEEYIHDINERQHAYDVAPYAGIEQTQGHGGVN